MPLTRSDGPSLWYSVEGDGDEVVLLVSGLGARAADWGPRFPSALASCLRVVRFDNRGVGDSEKPEHTWTLEDMADDAVRVLDAVGVQRAHIVGVSMGGMISQLVALNHPSRVARLVLVSTHFGGPEVVRPDPRVTAIYRPPRGMTQAELMRLAAETITAPGFAARSPALVEELVQLASRQPTPFSTFATQLQAILSSDRSARVKDIEAPTLVIHGELDPLIRAENGRRLAERIPGARQVTFPDHGHLLMWEAPEELARVALEFLRGSV